MGRRLILDTSSHNGIIDFGTAKRLNPDLVGVISKVNEGEGYVNPLFGVHQRAARQEGLLTGAYTFDRPSAAGVRDMEKMLSVIAAAPQELGLWVDCEVDDKLDPGTVNARFREDVAWLDSKTPHRVGVYTGRWFWDPKTRGSGWASPYRAWIANYGGAGPDIPWPWTAAAMWQYTDKLPIGNGATCDASFWVGTDADWANLTGGHAPTPPTTNPLEQTWKETQQIVHAVVDGVWGPDTDLRCEALRAMRDPLNVHNSVRVRQAQATLQVMVDGDWGAKSLSAWTSSVKKLQRTWGTAGDGLWGPGTDNAYLRVSPTR
jgi:hypothetical protein